MNKKGGVYDVGVNVVLSPLKFLAIIALLILVWIILLSPGTGEVDLNRLEANEVINHVINCITVDSNIDEKLIFEDFISSCLSADKYSLKINYGEEDLIVNERIYSSYKDFCGRGSQCESFSFVDSKGKELLIQVVFRKNE